MPETRQNKKIKTEDIEDKTAEVLSCAPLKQWICLTPGSLLETVNSESPILTLPHPKSGRSTQYVCHSGLLYEMMAFKRKYQSWFVDNVVQKDGSLYILTKVDPLFLVLDILQSKSSTDKFVPLSQILIDERYHDLPLLEHCIGKKQLSNICEMRHVDDEWYYRINMSKVIGWLKKKVHHLASHLITHGTNISDGSQAASFKKNSIASAANKDDALRYSFGMVTDYVSGDKLTSELLESLGIEMKKKNIESVPEPPTKKQKVTREGLPCLEDYREPIKAVKAKNEVKLTVTQKSLAKEGKRMKSMASFFSKKSAK